MPSFSKFWRSSLRDSSQVDEQERKEHVSDAEDGKNGLPGRSTARDLVRKLLRGSNTHSNSKRGSAKLVTTSSSVIPSPTLSHKKSSATMADSNKPLPQTPTQELQPEPAARPVKRLERIISPLTPTDLQKLFSGAPQFFARSEAHHTGAPYPSVAFPWDKELEIRDLSDHQPVHDHAWSSVSAWPHVTRDIQGNSDAVRAHELMQKTHYLPQCRERPNMLSFQGHERGTMGFQAALETGVADSLQVTDDIFSDAGAVAVRRLEFLRAKDGVRPLTETTLTDLLTRASIAYHESPGDHERPTIELYTELFTRILYPPSRVTDSADPYSLPVQVEVLLDVLGSSNIWFDFSLVEWRIRLGQILWGPSPEDEILVNNEVANDLGDQNYWLLLQILLSCELLMRLDAISADMDHRVEEVKASDIHRFDKKSTPIVRWSLILARQWLENIKIEKTTNIVSETRASSTGWLARLRSPASSEDRGNDEQIEHVQFYGRHSTRQLSGLLHFARKLSWPNYDSIAWKIANNSITIPDSQQGTPLETPQSVSTQRSSSYFTRPKMQRGLSKQSISAIVHPKGWLSNSYISGLILPGEVLSHFLISTLLENDQIALAKLGEEASLYGGFTLGGRSFWSTSCIVGRVLAAGDGASECMGWVSSPVVARTLSGPSESWFNIEVELPTQTERNIEVRPRIWQKSTIERDGSCIGGADKSSVLPGDFFVPSDDSHQARLSAKLKSLDLSSIAESVHAASTKEVPTPMSDTSESRGIQNYSASMAFSINSDGEEDKDINLALSNDVSFVTAFPCVPSKHLDMLRVPSSPHQIPDQREPSFIFTGHPLHKAFTFSRLPLSTVLTLPATYPFTSLLSPPQSPASNSTLSTTHTTNSPIPKVLVIDCTESTTNSSTAQPQGRTAGNDTEILARALCADRGWNAVIGRRGRNCLPCNVREAGALGWRVILRFS